MGQRQNLRLGIDLGGSKIFGALLENDRVIAAEKRRTKASGGYDAVVERIVKVARKVCEQGDVSLDSLECLGIGVPSPVVHNEVLHAPNLGWKRAPLARDLAAATGIPHVFVGNDVNCGAVGEATCGAGRGHSSVFCLFIGTGLGGGWVHDGHVHEGVSGFAGEAGHIKVPGHNAKCGCGQRGCLETFASKRGLSRMLKASKEAGKRCLVRSLDQFRSKEIEDAFRAGCPSTTLALEEMAKQLAWAMNTIACVINPNVFVLGGGIGQRLGNDLLPLIQAERQAASFVNANADYQVVIGTLGGTAVAVGAAELEVARAIDGMPPPFAEGGPERDPGRPAGPEHAP
jgi:glucokinase